jgi:predicted DNA-binding transcriptional regulator
MADSNPSDALRKLGLTDHETRVYLALAELGKSKVGDILRLSGIPSSKAYITLEKLLNKGLISYVLSGKHKTFMIAGVSNLNALLQKREVELAQLKEQLVPVAALVGKASEGKSLVQARVFIGVGGYKSMLEQALLELTHSEGMRTLGIPHGLNEILEDYLLEWNRKRIGKKLPMRIIYEAGSPYGKKREKMRHTRVRYLPKDIVPLSWTYVYADCVVLCALKPEFTTIVIKSEAICESYKKYFDLIWEKSKER